MVLRFDPADDSLLPLSSLFDDLAPQTARHLTTWAYYGPADCPHITADDVERAKADAMWNSLFPVD